MGFVSIDNIKHLIGLIRNSLNKKVDLVDGVGIQLANLVKQDNFTQYHNLYINPDSTTYKHQVDASDNTVIVNSALDITGDGISITNKLNNITTSITSTGIRHSTKSPTKVFATDGSLFDMTTKASLKDGKIDGSQVKAYTIYENKWKTDTPFVINNKVITGIYKAECTSGYIKWILIPLVDTEDQTFTAYSIDDKTYIYGEYISRTGKYNAPWELWLPYNLKLGTVTIDWQ